MEGVTDRAFRNVVRSLGGCGLTVTEFVSSEGLTRSVRDAWRMAELDPGEHPVAIQIYGRDPRRMGDAARLCEQLGADIVDINLGCPSKRVTSGCGGSALMLVTLAGEIFEAVRESITLPMTVKMRLGWDLKSINAPEVAALAEAKGACMVTVHGRSRCCFYKGHARWDELAAVKDAVSVPLLVNGDILGPDTARAALEASKADGVMIGRGVMRDPWTLARVAASFRGETIPEATLDERRVLIHDYLDRLDLGHAGPMNRRTLAKLRKVMGYFSKGMVNASKLRAALHEVDTVVEARALIDTFFASQPDAEARATA